MKKPSIRVIVVSTVAVALLTSLSGSVFAQDSSETRPGWGIGDQNHIHLGPPGQSVRPEFPDFEGDVDQFRIEIRAWAFALRNWILSNIFD
jgi:hypothetical protein